MTTYVKAACVLNFEYREGYEEVSSVRFLPKHKVT